MTSGMPFSDQEKQYIRDNAESMSKGMIAQQLGVLFPSDNLGYRSWRSVKGYLYRTQKGLDTVLVIRVPGVLIENAKNSGYSLEDIRYLARRAVIDAVQSL